MKRRAFLGLGVSSIGIGTLYGTGAFSAVSAGRGVAVNAVGDRNGLLGIENIDSTDDPLFTNNTGLEMVVALEEVDTTVTFDGESSPYTFPDNGTLDPDASRSVAIESEDDSQEVLVDITAEVFEDGDKAGTIALRRDFSVPQSAIADFTGEAKGTGGSGKFEFTLENVGDKEITFVGIGINATTTDADDVSKGNILVAGGTQLVDEPIPIDSSDPDTDTRRDFDPVFKLAVGESATFEFDRFQKPKQNGNGSSNVKMDGEDVRVTVYFGDSSKKVIDLCLGNCSGF